MELLEELEKQKNELEEQIASFSFPLYYSQVIKRDELIKQLKKVKWKIYTLKTLK